MRIVMPHPYIMGKCVVNYIVDEKQTPAGNSRFMSGGPLKIKRIIGPVTFIISQTL